MNACEYMIWYRGKCGQPSGDDKFCAEHSALKCGCGAKATGEDGETLLGSYVIANCCDQHKYRDFPVY